MNPAPPHDQAPLPIPSFPEWLIHSVDFNSYKKLIFINSYRCVLYGVLTILIFISLASIRFAYDGYVIIGEMAGVFEKDLPPLDIHNSLLIQSNPEPHSIIHRNFQIVIDPSGTVQNLDPLIVHGVIFHSDHLVLFATPDTQHEFTYASLGLEDIKIDAEILRDSQWISALLILIMSFGFRVVGVGLLKTFEALMGFFACGIMMDIFRRQSFRFHRINLAITAMAPALFLETVSTVFSMDFEFFYTLYIAVYGFFLLRGTYSTLPQLPRIPTQNE
jgi:hypothetical protein